MTSPTEVFLTRTIRLPRDGVTDLTVRHSGLSVEQGEHAGWTETLDRLAGLLESADGG